MATCGICGEPMVEAESMFKFHGFLGPCPKPPLKKETTVKMFKPEEVLLLEDRILVKLEKKENLTEGGLVIPENAHSMIEPPSTGTVVNVGPGRFHPSAVMAGGGTCEDMMVRAGDYIKFHAFSVHNKIQIGAEEFIIIRESDVMVILGRGDSPKKVGAFDPVSGKTDMQIAAEKGP